MKIYNEDKTKELNYEELDLEKGYLKEDVLTTHFPKIEPIEEEGHWKTIAEYDNGGKDVEWVIDVQGVKGQEEHEEKEDILVYVEYSEKEIKKKNNEKELARLEELISSTDYKAIKYAEGWYTEEEYEPIKNEREEIRKQIRVLQEELKDV